MPVTSVAGQPGYPRSSQHELPPRRGSRAGGRPLAAVPVRAIRTGKASPMTRLLSRAAVFLITVAVGCTALIAPALAAPAPTNPQAASGWLARQMVKGSHF